MTLRKSMQRLLVALITLLFLIPGAAIAASADDVVGIWLTVGGKSHVQITQAGGQYSGNLIWLKEPLRNGKPKMDDKNPDAKLRTRPLVGLSLLSGFTFKNGEWVNGKIYNPEDGKTYACQMKLKNANTLEVRGYVMGMTALGKTQVWTRK